MTFPLAQLREAATTKPAGWLDRVTAAGRVIGGHLHITRVAWARVSAAEGQWGDVVGMATQPIAGAIDAGAAKLGLKTDVKNCRGCAKRGAKLNGGGKLVG